MSLMGWKGPRRAFLNSLGKATAVGLSSSTLKLSEWASGKDVGPRGKNRSQECFKIREQCAANARSAVLVVQTPNSDEGRYPNFIGNYGKGLPHNPIGEVDRNAYQLFREAVQVGTAEAFENVPLGGTAKLVNPLAGLAFDLEGAAIALGGRTERVYSHSQVSREAWSARS